MHVTDEPFDTRPRTLLVIQRTETYDSYLAFEGEIVRGPSSLFRGLKPPRKVLPQWSASADPPRYSED